MKARSIMYVLSWVACLIFMFAGASVLGQGTAPNLFTSLRPDVSVVVKKHEMGADLVEMTFLDGNYPPDMAKAQIDTLAQMIGSSARGIAFNKIDMGATAQSSMLRINFAVDGLIDRSTGLLRVNPIAKALAGTPAPYTIHGIMVVFDREKPGPKTIRNYFPGDNTVEVQARADDPRVGVEYRIHLLSQKPDSITIPEGETPPTKVKPVQGSKSNELVIWTILVVASLAAGALVYSLLLQSRSAASRRRRR